MRITCPNCEYEVYYKTGSEDPEYKPVNCGEFYQLPLTMKRETTLFFDEVAVLACPYCKVVFVNGSII